jgi:hypothetical protein
MSFSECLLAQKYFSVGQQLRFFKEVQSKKENLLSVRNAMARDLTHVRRVFFTATLDYGTGARYFFPAILTFDRGFAEIIDFYTLRSCAIGPASGDFIPMQAHDFREGIYQSMNEAERGRVESLFTDAAVARRAKQNNGRSIDLEFLITGLVSELAAVAGCDFDDKIEKFF